MRELFSWVAAAAVAVSFAADAVGTTAAAANAEALPLTITNSSGYKGNVYVTIYGSTNPAQPNTWFYVTKTGTATPFTQSGQMKDYGFSFSGASTQLPIPMLQSARVYVSFGEPVLLTVNSDGVPSTPDGWTPGGTNFDTQFDFAEYTWVPNTGQGGGTQIWVDTTQVDAFGVPIRMTLKGNPGGTPTTLVGGFNSAVAGGNIIAALQKAGAPWKNLIVSDKSGPIRVISPVHAMTLASSSPYYFDNTYWDGYIDSVFTKYAKAGTTFGINTGGIFYSGAVVGGQMVLTPNNGEPATVFGEPTSQYLWGNGVPPVSGTNVPTLQKYIQAAFLRSTFLVDSTLSDCTGATPYTSAPINIYSKVIHQFAYQQEAYTFPYDDVCSLSSTISLLQPTSLSLTLYPLDAQALRRRR